MSLSVCLSLFGLDVVFSRPTKFPQSFRITYHCNSCFTFCIKSATRSLLTFSIVSEGRCTFFIQVKKKTSHTVYINIIFGFVHKKATYPSFCVKVLLTNPFQRLFTSYTVHSQYINTTTCRRWSSWKKAWSNHHCTATRLIMLLQISNNWVVLAWLFFFSRKTGRRDTNAVRTQTHADTCSNPSPHFLSASARSSLSVSLIDFCFLTFHFISYFSFISPFLWSPLSSIIHPSLFLALISFHLVLVMFNSPLHLEEGGPAAVRC